MILVEERRVPNPQREGEARVSMPPSIANDHGTGQCAPAGVSWGGERSEPGPLGVRWRTLPGWRAQRAA